MTSQKKKKKRKEKTNGLLWKDICNKRKCLLYTWLLTNPWEKIRNYNRNGQWGYFSNGPPTSNQRTTDMILDWGPLFSLTDAGVGKSVRSGTPACVDGHVCSLSLSCVYVVSIYLDA